MVQTEQRQWQKKTRFQNTNSVNVISNGYAVVLIPTYRYSLNTGIYYYYTISHVAANADRLQLQFIIIILHACTYLHNLTNVKIQYHILFAAIKTLEFVLWLHCEMEKKQIPIDIENMQSCNDF